jgi:hypothetical protein
MPGSGEQGFGSLRSCAELLRSRRAAPGLAGQGVLLGLPEGGADLQQLGHGMGDGLGELVGRPGTDRGPAEGRDPEGGLAVAGGPQLASQLVPGGHELGQR